MATRQRKRSASRRRAFPRKRARQNPQDAKPYRLVLRLNVEWFQGYAEEVRYLRESDGKPYKHVVETDAAELYLAHHPDYGNCLLIVDPSGRIPLWK